MDNPWCVEADVWRTDVAAQPPMIIDVTSVDYEYVEEVRTQRHWPGAAPSDVKQAAGRFAIAVLAVLGAGRLRFRRGAGGRYLSSAAMAKEEYERDHSSGA
jgi:hypothetical protein